MKNTISMFVLILTTTISVLFLGACSPNQEMVASQRSPEFFNQYLNPSQDFAVAESKIGELKVLEVGEEYPMRYVLFEDGRFYYQIDKLGDGTGWWKFEGGGLQLTAVRPIFDMHLYFSAKEASTDETVLRFNDRHGFNSVNIQMRDPASSMNVQGIVPTRLPELRPFTAHPAGI